MWSVDFSESGIAFAQYPYPAASLAATGKVAWSHVVSIDSTATPPEIRVLGEILFVPAPMREALVEWSVRHCVAHVRHIDVWALLLEPYLDTAFTDDDADRTLRVLEANGVTNTEVAQVRTEVGICMRRYNLESGLWDWCHLGLLDLLEAHRGVLTGESCRLDDDAFRRFYRRAMELALRGKPLG